MKGGATDQLKPGRKFGVKFPVKEVLRQELEGLSRLRQIISRGRV